MRAYLYRCRTCGEELTLDQPGDDAGPCGWCASDAEYVDDGPLLKRVWQVQFTSVMQEHFNPSVGKPISDRRQMDRELALASERATEKSGIPHRFVQTDGREAAQAAGIDPDFQREIANAKREGRRIQAEYTADTKADAPVHPGEFHPLGLKPKPGVNARTGRRVKA